MSDYGQMGSIPEISPFQYDGQKNGNLSGNVNLFRGAVSFYYDLFTLPGKNGLDVKVQALYQSDIDKQATRRNLEAPTGVMGLGWQFSYERIECTEEEAMLSPENRNYFLVYGQSQSKLYRIEETWECGALNESYAEDLLQANVTPALRKELLSQGLAVSTDAEIAKVYDGRWQMLDRVAEKSYFILRVKEGFSVVNGGFSYENAAFDFSRISYYPEFEKWEIIHTDGITHVYGGKQSGEEKKESEGNCIQWGVHWQGWQGASTHTHDTQGQRLQSQYAKAWNLRQRITPWGDCVTYAYLQTLQNVGAEGLPYTKACYLAQITDMFSNQILFAYEDKAYGEREGEGVNREYADPHKIVANDVADAYQSCYETKYLQSITGIYGDGKEINRIEFDYQLMNFQKKHTAASGDTVKRMLTSIRIIMPNGNTLPDVRFAYNDADETNPGALKEVCYPEGGTVQYTYAQMELPHCSERTLVISNPGYVERPKLWFGSDYVLLAWLQGNHAEIRIYSWLGRWQLWNPNGDCLGSIDTDSLDAVVNEEYVLLSALSSDGSQTHTIAIHKDSRIMGNWLIARRQQLDSSRCDVMTAEHGYILYLRDQNKVYLYSWEGRLQEWLSEELPGMEYVSGRRYFFNLSQNRLAVLDYDIESAPQEKKNKILIYEYDLLSGWRFLADSDASAVIIEGSTLDDLYFAWQFSGDTIAACAVTQNNSDHFQYDLHIWQLVKKNNSDRLSLETALCRHCLCELGSVKEVASELWTPQIYGALVLSCGNCYRYNGEVWLENENMAVHTNGENQSVRFAYGEDCILKSQIQAGEVTGAALLYDPNRYSQGWWDVQPAEIHHQYIKTGERGRYAPTISGQMATWDLDVYSLEPTSKQGSPFERPLFTLADTTNTDSILNCAPGYITCLLQEGETGRGTDIHVLENGSLLTCEHVDEWFNAAIKYEGTGLMPGSGATFYTYQQENDKILSLTLYRFTGQTLSQPVTNYQVHSVVMNDGKEQSGYCFEYDTQSAVCDATGQFVKYYLVKSYTMEGNELGAYTEYAYQNSLAMVTPMDNPNVPAALDGQLVYTATYDSKGKELTRIETTYTMSNIISRRPGQTPDRLIYGNYNQSGTSTQWQDGVKSMTEFYYDTACGNQKEVITYNCNGEGKPEKQIQRLTYGHELEATLFYANRLHERAGYQSLIAVEEGEPIVTEARAISYAPWKREDGALITAEHAAYRFKGTGEPYFDQEHGQNWHQLSQVELRSTTGMVLERQAPMGVFESHLFDRREQCEVAAFSSGRLSQDECFYYGFEEYEKKPQQWQLDQSQTPFAEDTCYTGSRSLFIPAQKETAALTLHVQPSFSEYLIGYWYYYEGETANAGIRITIGQQKRVVPVKETGKWVYGIQKISLEQASEVNISFYNQQGVLYIDNVCFSVWQAPPRINVYERSGSRLAATLGPYNDSGHFIYDDYDRKSAAMTNDLALEFSIPYLARDGGSTFNTELYGKAMGESFYDRFYNGGRWQDHWSSDQQSHWMSKKGSLFHEAAEKETLVLANPQLGDDYFACFLVRAKEEGQPFISLGQGIEIHWTPQAKKWSLDDAINQKKIEKTGTNHGKHWCVVFGETILFLVDGVLIFHYIPQKTLRGALALGAAGKVEFSQFIAGKKPQVGMHFLDGAGKIRQGQMLAGTEITITESIYDANGRLAIHTKPVSIAAKEGECFCYRENFVRKVDWQSGVLEGEINEFYPDDEGYPYVRQRFEDSQAGRVIEAGAPGKTFAITDAPSEERHTEKTIYGNNRDYVVPLLDLPLGEYYTVVKMDADQQETMTVFDKLKHKVAEYTHVGEKPLLTTYKIEYNGVEKTAKVFLPNQYDPMKVSAASAWTRTETYNFLGYKVKSYEPNSGESRYIYDDLGNLRFYQNEEHKKAGTILYQKYDRFFRKIEDGIVSMDWDEQRLSEKAIHDAEWPGSQENVQPKHYYHFDGAGDDVNQFGLLTAVDTLQEDGQLESKTETNYDRQVKPIKQKVTIPSVSNQGFMHKYTYDCAGNITSTTYHNGKTAFYEYDHNGRIQQVAEEDGNIINQYTYWPNDLLKSIKQGKDGEATYEYNAQGWLTEIKTPLLTEQIEYNQSKQKGPFNGKISKLKLALNIPDSMKQKQNKCSVPEEMTYKIEYDNAGRIRSAICYDAHGERPEWSIGKDQPIAYDANGNIKGMQVGDRFKEYLYEEGTDRVVKGGENEEYAYNANGSVIKATAKGIKNIRYSPVNGQPLEIETEKGKARYQYDAEKRRMTKEFSGKKRIYIYNAAGKVLEEIEQSDEEKSQTYYYSPYGMSAMRNENGVHYMHSDHLGSIHVMSKGGIPEMAVHYNAYGEILPIVGDPQDSALRYYYTGYEWDQESRLYNARARLYDPELARFYSVDPQFQDASPYIYCGNNPFNLTDPTGESSWWAILVGAILGVVLTVVTGGIGGLVAAGVASSTAGVVAGSVAVGAVAGAIGSVVGATVTSVIDSQPVTGKVLLSSLASGVLGGGVGALAGGPATMAIMRSAMNAGWSAGAVTGLGVSTSVIAGGAASVAANTTGCAIAGEPISGLNVGLGALAGMGSGLLASGAYFGIFASTAPSMPVEILPNETGCIIKNTLTAEMREQMTQRFGPLSFYSFIDEDLLSNVGNSMLRDANSNGPFVMRTGTNSFQIGPAITAHGMGRYMFVMTETPSGQLAYRPILNKNFIQWFVAQPEFALEEGLPVKLMICFSGLYPTKTSTAQLFANALNRTVYGTRFITYPGNEAQIYLPFNPA